MRAPDVIDRQPAWTATRHVRDLRLDKEARLQRAAVKDRRASNEVRRMVLASKEREEIARELIGSAGHWIESRGVANDGREKFAVFDPNGNLLCMRWGKPAAEAAVQELITTGKVTA